MAGILKYPSGIGSDNINFPCWIHIDIYDRKNPGSSVPYRSVCLYNPERLVNPNTVSWDNERLGFIGNSLAQSNSSWGKLASDGVSILATNAKFKAIERLVAAGGGRASADQLQGALSGKIRNPYLTMLFRGVDFRTFEMTFKFYPPSEQDCSTIDNIIREFKGSSVPEGASSEQTAFMGYPREFEIQYIWNGKENKYLHKFKRCVLTACESDYTGAGQWAAMRNGFPAETTLTLRFTETEIVLRDDIMKGGY